ncbi:unnamed protein product [Mycena citricolor]|uniref:Uncharacterized protein n=1 Tax=Mycena citricolor TaxID=2018698 RepID=A0AAD2GV63_9AGAR|nr:unnamed protein product [Mycena citricolor]
MPSYYRPRPVPRVSRTDMGISANKDANNQCSQKCSRNPVYKPRTPLALKISLGKASPGMVKRYSRMTNRTAAAVPGG